MECINEESISVIDIISERSMRTKLDGCPIKWNTSYSQKCLYTSDQFFYINYSCQGSKDNFSGNYNSVYRLIETTR